MGIKTFMIKTKREVIDEAMGHWIVAMTFRKASRFDEVMLTLWEQMHDIISLEIYVHRQHIHLCITADEANINIIQAQLYVMLNDAEFIDIPDPMFYPKEDDIIGINEYRPKEVSLLPFLDFDKRKHDILAPLLNTVSSLPYHHKFYYQLVAQRIPDDWKHQLRVKLELASWLAAFPFRPVFWVRPKVLERLDDARAKALEYHFNVNLRTAVVASPPKDPNDTEARKRIEKSVQDSLKCMYHGVRYTYNTHMGNLIVSQRRTGHKHFNRFQERWLKNPFWISKKELASWWHPIAVNDMLNVSETLALNATPPAQLSGKNSNVSISRFAHTIYRSGNIPFGLARPDRRSHVHIVGKSGVGKSKLIQLIASSDIRDGYGLALIDCHGDLVDELLYLIPQERMNDVAVLDFSDRDFPVCFNPFASVPKKNQRYMANEFLDTLKRVERLSLSEIVEQTFVHCLLTTMQAPQTSVISVIKMLMEPAYREQLIESLPEGEIKDYWKQESKERDEALASDEVHGIVRVLSHLLSSDLVSYVLGQRENRFDFDSMIENNKIILVKVPKKNLGRKCSVLLGSLVLSLLNVSAAERSHKGDSSRKDFYIFIDEFQNFASSSVTKSIAAGENNQICYTIAHQMVRQLNPDIYESLTGKVQNLICFQVGGEDAIALESRIGSPYNRSDMPNLDARTFYIRMSMEGNLKEAFSGRTDDVVYPENHFAEQILALSRKQYARSREEIESTLFIDTLGASGAKVA